MDYQPDNTPEWIKQHNQETAAQKARTEAAAQRRQEAAVPIEVAGPDFWQRFVDRVLVNAQALEKLDGEELVGRVSHATSPMRTGVEQNLYIQVNRQSVRFGPELSKMNLWYVPGGSRIRCWYQDQEMAEIQLAIRGNDVRAALAGNIHTAEDMADHIVQWMAERVKARRSA